MPKLSTDKSPYAWAAMRISLGLIFLWAFIDKLWGLGFATCRDAKTNVVTTMCSQAWVKGGSPTNGFLKFATKGPFASFYQNLAGNHLVDWLFMLGILLIGLALLSGVAVRLAAIAGGLLLLMMWSAALPPENHPFLDEHIFYIIALVGIAMTDSRQVWGLKNWWLKQPWSKPLRFLS